MNIPLKPGTLVKKNPDTWVLNDFDAWRGIGIGVVLEPDPGFEEDTDVKWPNGRCFEDPAGLIVVEE